MKNLILTAAIILTAFNIFAIGNNEEITTKEIVITAKKKMTSTVAPLDHSFSLSNEQFLVYPNNSSDYITVDLLNETEAFEIFIYDPQGRLISVYKGESVSRVKIDTESLKGGNYIVKVKNSQGYDRSAQVAIL